jgi:hypothetical protein
LELADLMAGSEEAFAGADGPVPKRLARPSAPVRH